MKAIQIDGKIKRFSTIPKAWGNVICGYDTLSSSIWEEAGFYDVVTPSYDSNTQYLGDLEWDADNSVFTYPIINRTWTQTVAQLKEEKIKILKGIYKVNLSETDWYIIREAEGGEATPQLILDKRAALRTECKTKEEDINALTTKAAVVSYSLPNLI